MRGAFFCVVVCGLTLAGCSHSPRDAANSGYPEDRDISRAPVPAEEIHETFATPDDAVVALLQAVQTDNRDALHKIFGPARKELMSGDDVQDENNFKKFSQRTLERAQIEERSPTVAILHIGNEDWPFPIPIAKSTDGRWYFDTVAGKAEILARRIGADELTAIAVCREYVNAQREYASMDHDNSGVLKYAQRLRSRPGERNGLYWETTAGEAPSPFGPLADAAQEQGYQPLSGNPNNPAPYHGYFFRILTKQGPDAPGGPYDYVINGNMIAGFALIATPATYGNSGVMTFIVSHQGKTYQKDLGPDTASAAAKIQAFNPDSTWQVVQSPVSVASALAKENVSK